MSSNKFGWSPLGTNVFTLFARAPTDVGARVHAEQFVSTYLLLEELRVAGMVRHMFTWMAVLSSLSDVDRYSS